jgi:hypothetical protein
MGPVQRQAQTWSTSHLTADVEEAATAGGPLAEQTRPKRTVSPALLAELLRPAPDPRDADAGDTVVLALRVGAALADRDPRVRVAYRELRGMVEKATGLPADPARPLDTRSYALLRAHVAARSRDGSVRAKAGALLRLADPERSVDRPRLHLPGRWAAAAEDYAREVTAAHRRRPATGRKVRLIVAGTVHAPIDGSVRLRRDVRHVHFRDSSNVVHADNCRVRVTSHYRIPRVKLSDRPFRHRLGSTGKWALRELMRNPDGWLADDVFRTCMARRAARVAVPDANRAVVRVAPGAGVEATNTHNPVFGTPRSVHVERDHPVRGTAEPRLEDLFGANTRLGPALARYLMRPASVRATQDLDHELTKSCRRVNLGVLFADPAFRAALPTATQLRYSGRNLGVAWAPAALLGAGGSPHRRVRFHLGGTDVAGAVAEIRASVGQQADRAAATGPPTTVNPAFHGPAYNPIFAGDSDAHIERTFQQKD